MKWWEKEQINQYRKWLKDRRYYSTNWIVNQLKKELRIIYDETVNSVIPLRIHSARSGKFKQVVFQVVFDLDRKYGYVLLLNKHFNQLRRKDVIRFKEIIEKFDPTFKGYWLKDERRFGSTNKVKEMVSVKKYQSRQIERLFGFKNGLYLKTKYGKLVDSLRELIGIYADYFRNQKIYPINF